MAKFPVTPGIDGEPMELKMTPLIDVIFQLLIFLMCALHFRSLETKLEAILPADKEIRNPLTDVRQTTITLIHNSTNPTEPMIKLNGRTIADYEELTRQLNNIRRTNNEISVTLEPQGQIPAQCVVNAIDACQKAGVIPKLAK
jgi:biopolymer transport protein ExbD